MILNGKNMVNECEDRFNEYVNEIQKKNNMLFSKEHLESMKSIFQAGFSGALETIIPKKELK